MKCCPQKINNNYYYKTKHTELKHFSLILDFSFSKLLMSLLLLNRIPSKESTSIISAFSIPSCSLVPYDLTLTRPLLSASHHPQPHYWNCCQRQLVINKQIQWMFPSHHPIGSLCHIENSWFYDWSLSFSSSFLLANHFFSASFINVSPHSPTLTASSTYSQHSIALHSLLPVTRTLTYKCDHSNTWSFYHTPMENNRDTEIDKKICVVQEFTDKWARQVHTVGKGEQERWGREGEISQTIA